MHYILCAIVFLITIESFTPFVWCVVRSQAREEEKKGNIYWHFLGKSILQPKGERVHKRSDFDIMHVNRSENNATVQNIISIECIKSIERTKLSNTKTNGIKILPKLFCNRLLVSFTFRKNIVLKKSNGTSIER